MENFPETNIYNNSVLVFLHVCGCVEKLSTFLTEHMLTYIYQIIQTYTKNVCL